MQHIERIEPNTGEWNLYYANHIVRYKFVPKQIKQISGKTILDIASGIGYGTHYLSGLGFKHVTGADISKETLEKAKHYFSSENITYINDDCNALKTANKKKYDALVSFETIEHLKNQESFVNEIYNMLEAGGTAIISTPNVLVTEHHSKDDWHFHEKELTPFEFYNLLENAGFDSVELYGQKYTQEGILRNDLRHEINILRSNPFSRLGMWLQHAFKGRKFDYPLPEKESDFQIKPYTTKELTKRKKEGPFVIIGVCRKK